MPTGTPVQRFVFYLSVAGTLLVGESTHGRRGA